MDKDLSKKIRNLTIELAQIKSVVGTKEENNVVERIYEKFTKMEYFKNNPELVRYVPVKDDPLERKSVMAIVKGEKGNSKKTVILIGHTDTVGISDYGIIQDYATKPLELADKLKEVSLPKEALEDLESGEYLFGRGVFDMKCGVATLMTLIESISNDIEEFEGNIVFAAVCDEEGNSGGMLSVVSELVELKEKEGFEYLAVIDTDYSAPRYEGDNTRYVYVGTVGKLMPSFYIVGSEAHGGDPFKGLDPNHISSAIVEEIDFNTKYCDEAEGEVTVPPISLRQQDLKVEYSVQTAKTSYLYFNFGTHRSTPDQILDKVIAGAELAFQKVIDSLNIEYKKYCEANGFPYEKLPWEARVMSYEELYNKVREEKGREVDKVMEELAKKLLDDQNIDERLFALKMVENLHNMWSDKNPVVIVYYSPPYYPHIYVKGESPLEKRVLDAVNEAIEKMDSDYDIEMKKFYPYISDLSYAAAPREKNAVDSLKNNMPGFGIKYSLPIDEMQKLNLPVVNIGPFGKDAHKFTERLEKDYSFNIAPKLVYETIMNLLK
ncbi:M20/M25/M40 family metallo-hydrolase [Tepidimicrobium xylanilyticum]|uniref:M20/M25/M40 family metallo-hydrolase n=1 Tax=Tepidimicrobium xylanilyticum TaxID=1123352 RepID=UPI00264CE365|nr:M20/M25/M40 family metallo-hydrolase [Tepidimicrobium xylanilyticum]GMG95262.1 peptidase M20 [Tepidimicrobium xylanilyticum]